MRRFILDMVPSAKP